MYTATNCKSTNFKTPPFPDDFLCAPSDDKDLSLIDIIKGIIFRI